MWKIIETGEMRRVLKDRGKGKFWRNGSSSNRGNSIMALEKTKEIVASNPVTVFSKTYCPYCVQVKRLLTKLGASFKAVELDTESDGSEVQAALFQFTGQRTVPNVFIGGKHIGGCDATVALNGKGGLVPLLAEAGAIAKVSAA